ncbi:hypothetical protein QQF64_011638 [Cirrhinus molitorella]|uniref:Secreted protein n=1 Tax=Cirrhinus molitorella TaxID=172907 RepID=A0ABR3LZU9_9TELE
MQEWRYLNLALLESATLLSGQEIAGYAALLLFVCLCLISNSQSIFYRPLLSPGGVCGVTSSGQPRTPTRPASLFAATFCAGDPDVAVNAGHHRLLTKACERVFCARLNGPMCTVKYGLPPVNVAAIKKSLA